MNRYLKMLLAAFMSMIIICASPVAAAEAVEEEQIPTHLDVACATHLNGNFFNGLFGRNTADLDVQVLLHGYNLVIWNGADGMFVTDPSVVSGLTVLENENGDRLYLMTLYDDLYFSDETKITAWDYAFSWLLLGSQELGELGVIPEDLSWVSGWQEYADGELPYLSGIHVIADDTLLVTVRHEALPFFYEPGFLSCIPYPIRTIAPGVKVFDDGYGVYLANDPDWKDPEADPAENVAEEPPRFTAELLVETILDPETGYLSHPSVVSGPYTLTAFNGDVAEFAKNPYYKGDFSGRSATIDTLTYRCLANEEMIPALEDGSIDLLDKVTLEETILAGMELIEERASQERTPDERFSMSNYPRIGQTFISFSRTRETVASRPVRQAIAWCMDRDEILDHYTGSFGLRTDGYYGLGQWMYEIASGNRRPSEVPPQDGMDAAAQAAYESRLADWNEVNLDDLTVYKTDVEKARTLLDENGWILNEDGLREKDGIVLDLTMAYPEGNRVREAFEEFFLPDLEKAGIRMTLLPLPMEELLELYYEQLEIGDDSSIEGLTAADPSGIDMFYLGSNYMTLFEPEKLLTEYASEDQASLERELTEAASHAQEHAKTYIGKALGEEVLEEQPGMSVKEKTIRDLTEAAMGRIYPEDEVNDEDPDLLRERMAKTYLTIYRDIAGRYRDGGSIYLQAMDMRRTQPGETLEYMQKWVRFQELVNEYLPIIPVYSNVYFDFYFSALEGFDIARNITWGDAILGAFLEPDRMQR